VFFGPSAVFRIAVLCLMMMILALGQAFVGSCLVILFAFK